MPEDNSKLIMVVEANKSSTELNDITKADYFSPKALADNESGFKFKTYNINDPKAEFNSQHVITEEIEN